MACEPLGTTGDDPGSDGNGSGHGAPPSGGGSGTVASDNALAAAFPQDLVISSPTAGTGQSLGLRTSEAISLGAYSRKRDALDAILAGTTVAECAFRFDLRPPRGAPACYGPQLDYSNHPGAMAPDSNTTDDDANPHGDMDGDGQLPGGDLGIWQPEDRNGEACAAATLSGKVSEVEALADNVIFTMASLFCLANVAGLELPEDGTLDLSEVVDAGFEDTRAGLTVTEASIGYDGDSYTTTLEATRQDRNNNAQTVQCRLRHRDAGNEVNYKGKLSCTIRHDHGERRHNCGQSSDIPSGETDALSVTYQKNSSSILTYEMRSANFCGATGVDPYVSSSDWTVDPSKKLNTPMEPGADNLTGWANNFHWGRFQQNINTGAGQYQFAWQAGKMDGHTRVFHVELEAEDQEGTQEGCAYFGFGPDVADEDLGAIDGMICNWAGPGHQVPRSPFAGVQRQCMISDASSGLFLPDETRQNITYAPTDSCDSPGVDGQGNPFSYTDGVTTVTGTVANDLYPLADMPTISAPEPDNIDVP